MKFGYFYEVIGNLLFDKIVNDRHDGLSWKDIANKYGIPASMVNDVKQEFSSLKRKEITQCVTREFMRNVAREE